MRDGDVMQDHAHRASATLKERRNPGLLEPGDKHLGAWRRCCIGSAFQEAGYNDTSPQPGDPAGGWFY
jgi:hypothetical protein